jgi:ligand-binding sensor domain-containing protein
LWVGTQNGVARQVSEGAFRGYGHSGGLPSDRVRKLYVDPNNSDRLYLGMIDGGGALVIPSTAE